MKEVMVIANPASAGGRTGRSWSQLASRLRAAGLDFDAALTSHRGEARELARTAVREGRRLVVAAGGDGTINEVANGFFDEGRPLLCDSRLGVLPLGTGGDFRRTFGIPLDPQEAAAVLRAGRVRRIDAGQVTLTLPGGGSSTVAFVNVADAGIGGEVVDRVNRGLRLASGELTFALASVLTGLRWKNKPMRVLIDEEVLEVVAQQVVVANCRYYGGGMLVAPGAAPDDGLLDVVVVGDLGILEAARLLVQLRRGTHLGPGRPKLVHKRAFRVEVSSPQPVRVDVDGEQPGWLPATFEVVPGALELVVP